MKRFLLCIPLFCMGYIANGQVVSIPDTNFLKALVIKGLDSNHDGKIQATEVLSVKKLDVSYSSISDLTGIESFINLDSLDCAGNSLKSLDLSKNQALSYLYCIGNSLASLDLSNNLELVQLNCDYNALASLDVSKNIHLEVLYCFSNKLTSLNLSNSVLLTELGCDYNKLTALDVTKNIALGWLDCGGNPITTLDVSTIDTLRHFDSHNSPFLSQICISKAQLADTGSWKKDVTAKYSTTCGIVAGLDDTQIEAQPKTLERIYTPLGEAVLPENATTGLFIYQYSDRTTKKVFKQ